jgi:hypothetical protein
MYSYRQPARLDCQCLETSAAAYPMLTWAKAGLNQKSRSGLFLLAHPTRFERVTFAFGVEYSLLLVESYDHSLPPAVEIGFTTTYQASPTQVAPRKFAVGEKLKKRRR